MIIIIAEVVKVMGYVGNKENPLIQIVRTHQHHTNSTPLQTVKSFKKHFQSETKKNKKDIIAQNIKYKKGCMDNFM
jgi:hypothetical protein